VRRLQAALAQIDAATAAHAAALADLDRLNQSILAKAFRGELVEQDHDDEPAELTLQRLAADASTILLPPRKLWPARLHPRPPGKWCPFFEILQSVPEGLSPEELFRQSGRSEVDLDQVERFYVDLRQLVRDGKVKETRPDSATVLLVAQK